MESEKQREKQKTGKITGKIKVIDYKNLSFANSKKQENKKMFLFDY